MMKNRALRGAAWVFLVSALGLVLTALDVFGLYARFCSGMTAADLELLISLVVYIPFMLIPVLLWARRREDGAEALRADAPAVGTGFTTISIGLLMVPVSLALLYVWSTLLSVLGVEVSALSGADVVYATKRERMTAMLCAAGLAPLFEELLYRGVLFGALERTRGRRAAAVISAVLFALSHMSVIGLPVELACGVLLAAVVYYADSVYAGILLHSVYNAGCLFLSFAATDIGSAATEAESAGSVLPILVFAGCCAVLIRVQLKRLRAYHAVRHEGEEEPERQRFRRLDLLPAWIGAALLMTCVVLTLIAA